MELVDAVTRVPFKEHRHSDGKVYAEVEPDAEYFIAIRILKEKPGYNAKVYVTYVIDGVPLGYSHHFYPKDDTTRYRGCSARVDGVSSETALKFASSLASLGSSGGSAVTTKSHRKTMGTIKLEFSEAIHAGYRMDTDFTRKLLLPVGTFSNSGGGDSHKQKKKKGLQTVEGSFSLTKSKPNKQRSFYNKGKLLDTITIHYCTAAGLIDVGVLPPWQNVPHQQTQTTRGGDQSSSSNRRRQNKRQKIEPSLTEIESTITLDNKPPVRDGRLVVNNNGVHKEVVDLSNLASDVESDEEDDYDVDADEKAKSMKQE